MHSSIDPITRMCADPERAQRSALHAILSANATTEFCKAHGLEATTSIADFRARVPIRNYDAHRPFIDRMLAANEPNILVTEPIEMWAKTSGSTSKPKLVPITRSWIRATQVAQRLLLEDISSSDPIFIITSPTSEGSVTELGLVTLGTRYGRIHTPTSSSTNASPEAHSAHALIADRIDQSNARTLIAASPSTLLLVLDRLPDRSSIETLACWCSGASSLYLPALRERCPNARIRDVGLTSSEGYFTVSTDGSIAALPIATHHFFELQSSNNDVLQLHEAIPGHDYRLIVTTPSGLYRYDTEDIVHVHAQKRDAMPLLSFTHRAGSVSSITGEKLTEAQLVEAMLATASRFSVVVEDFLAEVEQTTTPPRYLIKLSPSSILHTHPTFASELDRALCEANIEYAKRRTTSRLGPARIETSNDREFRDLRERNASPDLVQAQYKLLPLRVRS